MKANPVLRAVTRKHCNAGLTVKATLLTNKSQARGFEFNWLCNEWEQKGFVIMVFCYIGC